jgi:NAD(P)-dependent dehydrogenase (short-subunit alcohol dehydrogenase family)
MSRNALITGAGRRIGRAIARALAEKGWGVALHYRHSAEATQTLQGEFTARGGHAAVVQADLAETADVQRLVAKARDALGPLHCLINNASLFENDTLHDVTAESFHTHLDTNLLAPLLLTRDFARQLPPGEQGNVINIADQRVFNLRPDFLSYTLSKTGLWTLGYGPSPEEIARAVLFILDARSMTGEFIALDGGQHLPTSGQMNAETSHE